jgi:hypothetical protein
MLQHNAIQTGKRAHLAHAAVVGLHALCCGLPALAMLSAAAGAAASAALIADFIGPFHAFLHQHELWVLAVSGLLVTVGAALEAWARRRPDGHGFPWLFAFSVFCFLANAAIVAAHRTWG